LGDSRRIGIIKSHGRVTSLTIQLVPPRPRSHLHSRSSQFRSCRFAGFRSSNIPNLDIQRGRWDVRKVQVVFAYDIHKIGEVGAFGPQILEILEVLVGHVQVDKFDILIPRRESPYPLQLQAIRGRRYRFVVVSKRKRRGVICDPGHRNATSSDWTMRSW